MNFPYQGDQEPHRTCGSRVCRDTGAVCMDLFYEISKLIYFSRSSPLPFFALSNLLTLFSHDMPTLPLIQHVFDYLLCRPPIASVYLAAAVSFVFKMMSRQFFYIEY